MIPRTKPFIRSLISSPNGTLWVWRWPQSPTVGTVFDVFGPDGQFCGSVVSDLRLSEPMQVTESGLAAVVLDELDVPHREARPGSERPGPPGPMSGAPSAPMMGPQSKLSAKEP